MEQNLRTERLAGERNVVGADGVNAPCSEATHQGRVVHGPRDHSATLRVRSLDQGFIDEVPLAPEIARVDPAGGGCGIDGVARLEHSAGHPRGDQAGLSDESMVEAVHSRAGARRVPRDAFQGAGGDVARLEFDIDAQVRADRREDLVECGDRLPLHSACSQLGVGEGVDGPQPRNDRVVMDDDDSIGGAVDVELCGIGAELHCPAEGGEGILRSFPGGPSVGDDLWSGHEPILTPGGCRRLIG